MIPTVCPVCPLNSVGNRLVPRPFRVVAIELVERKPPNRVSPTCRAVMAYLIRSVVSICLQLVIIRTLIVMCSPVFSTLKFDYDDRRSNIFEKRERYCTVGKKLCSRPCFVRPVIAQNTARFRISLRNSRRTTVAGESFFACSTPSAFRSRFFRRTR